MASMYNGADRRRGGPDRRNPDVRVKILLVDDHALFRVGMRQILEREPDFDIVAEAEDPRTAFDAARDHTPDIVLLDLSLPAPGGIETTQRIKREVPATGIIAGDETLANEITDSGTRPAAGTSAVTLIANRRLPELALAGDYRFVRRSLIR